MIARLCCSVSLLFLVVTLSGCPATEYEIVSPEPGSSWYDEMPHYYEFTYIANEPKVIALNGVNVVEYFTMSDGVGHAEGSSLEAFIQQGYNTLTIEPGEFGHSIEFLVDTEGPSVSISKVTGGETKRVTGQIKDPSGVQSLTINGVHVVLNQESDEFTVSVKAANRYQIVASDNDNRSTRSTYNARKKVLENGLKTRITQKAVNETLPIAQEIIEDLNFNKILADANGSPMTLFREKVAISLPRVEFVPKVCVPQVCTPKVCLLGICTPKVCTPRTCTPAVAAGPIKFDLLRLEARLVDIDVKEVEVERLDIASGRKPLIGEWDGFSLVTKLKHVDFAVKVDSYLLGVSEVVRGILDLLKLRDKIDLLDGQFVARAHAKELYLAADLGLTASKGKVDVTIADINSVGINGVNSDFKINVDVPDAFNLFGFDLAQKTVNLVTKGIGRSRDRMVEVVLGNIVPAVVDPIIDPFINELRFGMKVGVSNNTALHGLFQVRDIQVIDNNTALLVGIDSLIGAEKGKLGDISWGVAVGEIPHIFGVNDHVLPDRPTLPESLGPAPNIAPQALGYRHLNVKQSHSEIRGGDVSILTTSSLINQSLLAFHDSALLQFSIGYHDGNFSIEPSPHYTHRLVVQPTAPTELIFKGSEPLISFLRMHNFKIQLQEKQPDGKWSNVYQVLFDAELPVVIGHEKDRFTIELLSTDLNVISTDSNGTDFTLFSMNTFLNRVLTRVLIEQLNIGLSQLKIPGMLGLEHDSKKIEAQIKGISASSDEHLLIKVDLKGG